MVLQAISAQIVRHKRVLADDCIVIATAELGWFNEELFTGHDRIFAAYAKAQTLVELQRLGEEYALDPELVANYRDNYGFHPFHGFSMISSAQIAEQRSSAIYLAGAERPDLARAIGMPTRATAEECIADALLLKGPEARILALPQAFKRAAVHLCLTSDEVTSTP